MNLRMTIPSAIDAQDKVGSSVLVGYVEGAIGGPQQLASLAALFPHVRFRSVGSGWPEPAPAGLSALIVEASDSDIEAATRRLTTRTDSTPVIVVLDSYDANSSRRLLQAGAADILLAPVSEAALALSLERMFSTYDRPSSRRSQPGRIVGLLKAGGGVGATALGAQLVTLIAGRHSGDNNAVCFADLDLQFGLGALFLDLGESMSLTDVLDGGGPLEDTPLASALARHRSGARLLAAPRDLTPLEAVSPEQITGVLSALRRDFALTLLDLPTVWNAWTYQALQLCDQIVLITNLSVPHTILAKRQLRVLALQRLDTIGLTMVCNRISADQKSIISLKDAEKAIGRTFDLTIPEDRALMNDAVAQGCAISTLRPGTKLEKAIADLAGLISAVPAVETKRRWPWS